MNNNPEQNTTYTPEILNEAPKKSNAVKVLSIISMCLGITAFFCNPLSLFPLAAIILGIVALVLAKHGEPKGMAIAGIACGGSAALVQFFFDLIFSFFTFGLSFIF